MLNAELREQLALVEAVAKKFLDDHYSFESRQEIIVNEPGYSQTQWESMAELGWFKLAMDTAYDGLGCDADFVAALMQEFGKSLYLSPYLASIGLAARIIELQASETLKSQLLPAMGDGKVIVTCAFYEAQSRYELKNIRTAAKPQGDQFILNGTKTALQYGAVATHLLVLAKQPDINQDKDGFSLFLVPANQKGVELKNFTAHDGSRVSTLQLVDVKVSAQLQIGSQGSTMTSVDLGLNYAVALTCAEMVGVLETVQELTLDYIKTRTQFGQTIGSFQALQHRAVDMYMRLELARSMSLEAIRAVQELDLTQQSLIVSAAKHEIGKAAILNAEEGLQMHGAMGMMNEMMIGHCLKRLFTLNLSFGDPDFHLNRYRMLRVH